MVLVIVLLFLSCLLAAHALSPGQAQMIEEALDAAGNDKARFEQVIGVLDSNEADLSDNPALAERIVSTASELDVDLYQYENIKGLQRLSSGSVAVIIGVIVLIIITSFLAIEFARHRKIHANAYELIKEHKVSVPSAPMDKLARYIETCLSNGYTAERIESLLFSYGWKKEKVSGVIREIQLKNMIKTSMKRGYKKGYIRKELLTAGWPEKTVDKVFRQLRV